MGTGGAVGRDSSYSQMDSRRASQLLRDAGQASHGSRLNLNFQVIRMDNAYMSLVFGHFKLRLSVIKEHEPSYPIYLWLS